MDRLETIMSMQKGFQERLGTNFANMSDEERANFMRNHRGYLADEVAEALYEMPNYKLWKNYDDMSPEKREVQWQKVRMELIDSLHFFVNLLLGAGMTAEEVYQMYMAKNKENHRRQDDGYDSEVSYRDQAVEDVMKPTCSVNLNGEAHSANNFIAMLVDDDGSCSLLMNADTAMVGIMANILADAYLTDTNSMSIEDRAAIAQEIEGAMANYREANNE